LVGLVVAAFVAAGLTALSGARPWTPRPPGCRAGHHLRAARGARGDRDLRGAHGRCAAAGRLPRAPEATATWTSRLPGIALASYPPARGRSGRCSWCRSPSRTAWDARSPTCSASSVGGGGASVGRGNRVDVHGGVRRVVFAGCRIALSWGSSVALLAVAVVGLMRSHPPDTPRRAARTTSHGQPDGARGGRRAVVGGLVAVLALASQRAEAPADCPPR